MKKGIRSICGLLLAVMAAGCVLPACGQQGAQEKMPSDASSEMETGSQEDSGEPEEPGTDLYEEEPAEEAPQEYTGPINDLTGLPIDQAKTDNRPVAVMINNIDFAQPLMGVSKADVMYECLVEGAITRIMACFKDPTDVPEIGSVRSARTYYIRIAQGMDAIFCHSGSSTTARELLSAGVVDSFDLGEDMMWRDQWRMDNMGYEHSVLSSGELLENGIADYGVRRTYEGGSPETQQFSQTDSQVLSGENCSFLSATFSSYKDTTFTYDAQEQTYLVGQFGEAQMDGTYGVQNARKNVLVLFIPTYSPDGDILQHMDLIGSGGGYYASQGKVIPIIWHKDSDDTPFYYTTESGEQLIMTPGNSYVCCIPMEGHVLYE